MSLSWFTVTSATHSFPPPPTLSLVRRHSEKKSCSKLHFRMMEATMLFGSSRTFLQPSQIFIAWFFFGGGWAYIYRIYIYRNIEILAKDLSANKLKGFINFPNVYQTDWGVQCELSSHACWEYGGTRTGPSVHGVKNTLRIIMGAHYSLICLERSILSGYGGWILFVFFQTSLKLASSGLFNRQTKAFQLLWNISKAAFLCSLCFNKRMWLKEIMVFLSWVRDVKQ